MRSAKGFGALFAAAVLLGSVLVGMSTTAVAVTGSGATLNGVGSSATVTGTVGANNARECSGRDDPVCITHAVTVVGGPLTVHARLTGRTSGQAADDFDLFFYGDGTATTATSGSSGSTPELIDVVLHDGTYTFQVQPYQTAAGAHYDLQLAATAVAPKGSFTVPAAGGTTTFQGNAPSKSPSVRNGLATCAGNASPFCHLYQVQVPFAGGQMSTYDRSTKTLSAAEFAVTIYDGGHRVVAENRFIDGDDRITTNLPGAGSYYVKVETTVARAVDRYALDIAVAAMPDGGGTPISPDPGPQPADQGLFTKTIGFASKTGFRGIVAWQASAPVLATVHYGTSPTALTLTATTQAPDSAGMLVLEGLAEGRLYYWQVEDLITGQRSVVKSFASTNAYTEWTGSAYTIDLVVQVDSNALPDAVPHDLGLNDIGAGMNIFAERIYDATDGLVRIGNILITDTNVDYAANVPGNPATVTRVCTPTNYADTLVQTSMPFDSHTYGYAIADACRQFYLGRIGQLVYEWQDDMHVGYVAAHEVGHYAFGAPDLYDLSTAVALPSGCANDAWDGSLMNNAGDWDATAHRWRLTELDRNPTLTPCDHSNNAAYTWDTLRSRYLNVPLRPDGPIEHIYDDMARGNADGGALSIHILDREPGLSTLMAFTPDDTDEPGGGAACAAGDPQVTDPQGDATELVLTGPTPAPNDGGLDVTAGKVSAQAAGSAIDLIFTIDVADLDAPPSMPGGNFFRFYFTHDGVRRNVVAARDADGQTSFALYPVATTGSATPISGSFDDVNNRITLRLPAALVKQTDPTVSEIAEGSVLSALQIIAQRDTSVGIVLTADTANGSCNYTVTTA